MRESRSTSRLSILLVTNMWPSAQMPFAGIFVKNLYEWLKLWCEQTQDVEVDVFFMRRRFTSVLGSITKYGIAALQFLGNLARRYDVIHLHYFYPLIVLVWVYKTLRPGTRVIVTFHGGDIQGRYQNRWARAFFRWLAGSIDQAFVVGAHLRRQVQSQLRVEVVEVLSAGVDSRTFYYEPVVKEYDFVFVGAFTQRKGVDLLVEALHMLAQRDVRMCFVGSGPLRPRIEMAARSCHLTVLAPQPQDAVRHIFNAGRFLVLPSRVEPFGLVVSEALFCGTPALATPTTGWSRRMCRVGPSPNACVRRWR
jgi:L-malate glycosyltransferase